MSGKEKVMNDIVGGDLVTVTSVQSGHFGQLGRVRMTNSGRAYITEPGTRSGWNSKGYPFGDLQVIRVTPADDKFVHRVYLGDLCISCGRSTRFGSGLYVNRVGADDSITLTCGWIDIDGQICPECDACENDDCPGCMEGGFDLEKVATAAVTLAAEWA